MTIGHIDECHYVSTTALQSNASISVCNELTNDTQSSRNKHIIVSIYAVCFSVIKSCTYWDFSTLQALHEHACLFYEKCNVDRVGKMPSNVAVYDAEIKIKYLHLNQGSLTQCYLVNKDSLVKSILKENIGSCVIPTRYLLDQCNDVLISFIVQRNTQNNCCFMLTCENEQFHLLRPFSLNALVKRVSEIYRQDDCINDGKNICLILYFAH